MKMEFIFDEEKLKKEGYTEEQCLDIVRDYFKKFNSDTIKETKKGFFEGTEKDWGAFGSTANFLNTNWFPKVIKEWYWYHDGKDSSSEVKGDMLQAYYEVKKMNI